ncbi:MAG: hypothetical protein JXR83_14515 [Deltaproteobacteria bacterium]|nr:hypothetical protein [Deltaproteobacteria bacterium]
MNALALLLTSLALPTTAEASYPRLEIHAELLNLLVLRSDGDFDRTPPLYDEEGQSIGALASVFRPSIAFEPLADLRLFYEAELGLNYWSKNNPDQESALGPDIFVLKQRQIYAAGELLDRRLAFKVGYQYLGDPTELFVGHWLGAAAIGYRFAEQRRVDFLVAQVPDQTYEGLDLLHNNFSHDIFVLGPTARWRFGPELQVAGGVIGLYDGSVVRQPRWLAAPALHVEGRAGDLSGALDGVLQAGQVRGAALGGADQNLLAWAGQGHGSYRAHRLGIDLNLLALSPDDADDGNVNSGSFLYSSRSRSATMLLTEDPIRNWYDQLDRRLASYRGGFWEHRAGLLVADLKASFDATEHLRPALVVAGASVLQPDNALGEWLVGIESDVVLELHLTRFLVANLAWGVLVPGGAAAAIVNRISRTATDPVSSLEASLLVCY